MSLGLLPSVKFVDSIEEEERDKSTGNNYAVENLLRDFLVRSTSPLLSFPLSTLTTCMEGNEQMWRIRVDFLNKTNKRLSYLFFFLLV